MKHISFRNYYTTTNKITYRDTGDVLYRVPLRYQENGRVEDIDAIGRCHMDRANDIIQVKYYRTLDDAIAMRNPLN